MRPAKLSKNIFGSLFVNFLRFFDGCKKTKVGFFPFKANFSPVFVSRFVPKHSPNSSLAIAANFAIGAVLLFIAKAKIFPSVVMSDSVHMIDKFVFLKRSSNHSFHNQAMKIERFSRSSDLSRLFYAIVFGAFNVSASFVIIPAMSSYKILIALVYNSKERFSFVRHLTPHECWSR